MPLSINAMLLEMDWNRTIGIFVLCSVVAWFLAFPIGRILEDYTKERTVRVIWIVAMLFCGAFFFLSMSGVGEVVFKAAEGVLANKAAEKSE